MSWWDLWSKNKDETKPTVSELGGNNLPPSSDTVSDDYGSMSTPQQEAQTLSDIIRGIAHAASAANEIQDQQFIQQIDHYFHKLDDGTLEAKVVRVKIDDKTFIESPLIGMIDPATLGLEEMTVRMGIRLSRSEVKKAVNDAKNVEVSRASFNVSLTGCKPGERQDVMDVTMVFRKAEASEGAVQLIEAVRGAMQPKKYDDNTKKPHLSTNIFTNKLIRTSKSPDGGLTRNQPSPLPTNPIIENEIDDFEPQDIVEDDTEE